MNVIGGMPTPHFSFGKKYGFLWITLLFFLLSVVGHWFFGWQAYVQEQMEHQSSIDVNGYIIEMLRDTLENWQSEFLQLMWQVAGLAFLFYIGSPQSKEGDERKEEKIDELLKALHPTGKEVIAKLDKQYPRA
jgi:hypothetical protein